jgi:hypothetical protein
VKSTIAGLQAKLDGLAKTPGPLAQQINIPSVGREAYFAKAPRDAISVRVYINRDVYNDADEKIGVINDLVVGTDAKIAAAILGVGGFLGIGEKEVAVPFSSIQIKQRGNDWHLVTDATKNALKEAPAYEDTSSRIRSDPSRK